MGRGRGRRDNELIGQTVRISQGPYKGQCCPKKCHFALWSAFLSSPPLACISQFISHKFHRLHWCSEGCNRVYGQGRAAFHLSDHLCGSTALNHHVCCSKKMLLYVVRRRAKAAFFFLLLRHIGWSQPLHRD